MSAERAVCANCGAPIEMHESRTGADWWHVTDPPAARRMNCLLFASPAAPVPPVPGEAAMDEVREVMLDVFRARLPDGGGPDRIDEPFTDDEYAYIAANLIRPPVPGVEALRELGLTHSFMPPPPLVNNPRCAFCNVAREDHDTPSPQLEAAAKMLRKRSPGWYKDGGGIDALRMSQEDAAAALRAALDAVPTRPDGEGDSPEVERPRGLMRVARAMATGGYSEIERLGESVAPAVLDEP